MNCLLVSHFAEPHLNSSTAQNTRLLAGVLVGLGHQVRVVCASDKETDIEYEGYAITGLPIRSSNGRKVWLGRWRPDPQCQARAEALLNEWKPHLVYMGAWGYLLEYGLAAIRRGIPVVQMIHDYSLLCMRHWLLDSWNRVCLGPETANKCYLCMENAIGVRARLMAWGVHCAARLLPLCRETWGRKALPTGRARIVEESFEFMRQYRNAVTLYLAQSPDNIRIMGRTGLPESRFRLLPQFIGEDKLTVYPRAAGVPGKDRPLRFIFVGRWSAEKGVADLVDAYLRAFAAPETELRLVLSNPQVPRDGKVPFQNVPLRKRICVLAGLKGAEVSQAIAQCDVCVVPSTCMEVGSRVVLEAHAQGVPVICSSTVGNRYTISDGKNGRIFPVGDVAALKDCLEEVARNPSLLSKWGMQLTSPVDRTRWKALLVSILEDVVRNSRNQSCG